MPPIYKDINKMADLVEYCRNINGIFNSVIPAIFLKGLDIPPIFRQHFV